MKLFTLFILFFCCSYSSEEQQESNQGSKKTLPKKKYNFIKKLCHFACNNKKLITCNIVYPFSLLVLHKLLHNKITIKPFFKHMFFAPVVISYSYSIYQFIKYNFPEDSNPPSDNEDGESEAGSLLLKESDFGFNKGSNLLSGENVSPLLIKKVGQNEQFNLPPENNKEAEEKQLLLSQIALAKNKEEEKQKETNNLPLRERNKENDDEFASLIYQTKEENFPHGNLFHVESPFNNFLEKTLENIQNNQRIKIILIIFINFLDYVEENFNKKDSQRNPSEPNIKTNKDCESAGNDSPLGIVSYILLNIIKNHEGALVFFQNTCPKDLLEKIYIQKAHGCKIKGREKNCIFKE